MVVIEKKKNPPQRLNNAALVAFTAVNHGLAYLVAALDAAILGGPRGNYFYMQRYICDGMSTICMRVVCVRHSRPFSPNPFLFAVRVLRSTAILHISHLSTGTARVSSASSSAAHTRKRSRPDRGRHA